jgi:predicted ABC-type ATPase
MASNSTGKPPALWIIAGPNGSGKSSAYGTAAGDEPVGAVWIINPDLLAKRIGEQEGLDGWPANLEAVNRIEAWLYASIEAHQTVGVETVLSTDKYRRLVERARQRGFRINLLYVYLETADLNIERVRTRVRKGGHAVAEDKIVERRARSLQQLPWSISAADRVEIYDNSGATPRLVLSKVGDELRIYDRMIPEVIDAVDAHMPGFRTIYDEAF